MYSELLDDIQSHDGYYAVLGLKGEARKQLFAPTRNELDSKIGWLLEQKYNVYFGISKFINDEERTKANVLNIKAIWLDLDCGEDKAVVDPFLNRPKGYLSQDDALQVLREFCEELNLPRPWIINSGNGLHVYWPLAEAISRKEWEPIAKQLKKQCKQHNLFVDNQVFEAARVLRVPGTLNYKTIPPKKVTVICKGSPVEIKEIKELLGVVDEADKPTIILSDLQKSLMNNVIYSFDVLLEKSNRGVGCQQIKHHFDDQDVVSEPMWFDILSIAQHCVDNETAIHRVSEKHPEYDAAETEKKASHIISPHLCETFESNAPGGCDGCQWYGKIKTPLVLGKHIETKPDVALVEEMPTCPFPYKRGARGGIYVQSGDENNSMECVFEHDLYVVKRMRDPTSGEVAVINLRLPHDGIIEFNLPLSTIADSKSLKTALATQGAILNNKNTNLIANYLQLSVKELQCKRSAEKMRRQFGWYERDTIFVVGDKEIKADSITYSPPSDTTKPFCTFMHHRGTLEKWKEVFNLYGRPGLEPQAFAALTGFGAPLFKFTGLKGAVINLIHKDSGTGKSTALYMMNSIFGHPSGIAAEAKDTLNAKLLQLGVMNNLAYGIDEVTNMSPIEESTILYSVSQGRGPHRVKASANELRANLSSWQTMAVTTSNASMYDKMKLAKASPEGEAMRLIEYKVDRTDAIHIAEAKQMFERQLLDNYGHAGVIYMQYVIKNLKTIIGDLHAVQTKLDLDLDMSTRERFWSAAIACNITGGLIAKKLGLLDWDMASIYAWLPPMIKSLRHAVISDKDTALQTIGTYVNLHINNTLVVDGIVDNRSKLMTMPHREPKGELLIRYEQDTKLLYLATTAFRNYCAKHQIHYAEVIAELKRYNIVVRSEVKRLSKGMNIVTPPISCLSIDCSSLGGDYISFSIGEDKDEQ